MKITNLSQLIKDTLDLGKELYKEHYGIFSLNINDIISGGYWKVSICCDEDIMHIGEEKDTILAAVRALHNSLLAEIKTKNPSKKKIKKLSRNDRLEKEILNFVDSEQPEEFDAEPYPISISEICVDGFDNDEDALEDDILNACLRLIYKGKLFINEDGKIFI